ncbi:MAG: DNA-processing protein DprA, partial [Bacteroidota bacterium]
TMAPAIGPVTARKLIEEFGSARIIFEQKKWELFQQIKGIGPGRTKSFNPKALLEQADRELKFIESHRICALYSEDPGYPKRLLQCPDAPIVLFTRGDQGLHCRRSLSVVGTRRASPYGRDLCRKIVSGLASMLEDLVIVSGLAYGIDVIAHRTALESGIPTVAVLGHGMSTIYPSSHRETAVKIIEQGALVTDFHSGMGPEPNNFLRRNRIIAGLANATLVVESAKTGGALITAGLASSYGRDVLAVPGRIDDKRSRGCNALIKSSIAALVESPEDVIHHLNWDSGWTESMLQPPRNLSFTPDEKQLLSLISDHRGMDPGQLSSASGLPIQNVLTLLLEMELKDWIHAEPGNRYHPRITLS